jgi:hypothetical protein
MYLFLWKINKHARKFMIENWNQLSDEALEKNILVKDDEQYGKIAEILRKKEIEYVRSSVASSQIIKLFVYI